MHEIAATIQCRLDEDITALTQNELFEEMRHHPAGTPAHMTAMAELIRRKLHDLDKSSDRLVLLTRVLIVLTIVLAIPTIIEFLKWLYPYLSTR
jgi:hypothetical protein